jgi:hypothetical protein
MVRGDLAAYLPAVITRTTGRASTDFLLQKEHLEYRCRAPFQVVSLLPVFQWIMVKPSSSKN